MQLHLERIGRILPIGLVVFSLTSLPPGSRRALAQEPSGTTSFTAFPFNDPPQQALFGMVEPGGGGGTGFSVAIDGTTVVVGAPSSDVSGVQDAGAVFIFELDLPTANSWHWVATLLPPSAQPTDQFGWSVGVSGSTVVVGARLREAPGVAGSNHGAVYVYDLGTPGGGVPIELIAPDAAPGDAFGYSVGIGNDPQSNSLAVVVGAPGHDGAYGVDSGKAYLFRNVLPGVWTFTATLGEGSVAKAEFGKAVAVAADAELAAVGAPGGKPGVVNVAGSVTIFDRTVFDPVSSWANVVTLTGDPADPLSLFGHAVAVSGASVIVGAPWSRSTAGAAHVFLRKSFGFFDETKLFPTDASANARFGQSVAIAGSGCSALVGQCTAVVGQSFLDHAVYVFDRVTDTLWGDDTDFDGSADETQKLRSPRDDIDPLGGFGESAAMSGRRIVVGAPLHDLHDVLLTDGSISDVSNAGAAFIFTDEAAVSQDSQVADSAILEAGVVVQDGAVVLNGAYIGANTVLGPSAVIGTGATVGSGSVIDGFVAGFASVGSDAIIEGTVASFSNLGDHVVIEAGARVLNYVEVGSNVLIGENAIVRSGVTIGDGVTIESGSDVGAQTQIWGDSHLGARVTIHAGASLGMNVTVGDDTEIYRATIEDDVVIGQRVVVGNNVTIFAGSEVPDDTSIPNGCTAMPIAGGSQCVG